jgi:hypothetical protein
MAITITIELQSVGCLLSLENGLVRPIGSQGESVETHICEIPEDGEWMARLSDEDRKDVEITRKHFMPLYKQFSK